MSWLLTAIALAAAPADAKYAALLQREVLTVEACLDALEEKGSVEAVAALCEERLPLDPHKARVLREAGRRSGDAQRLLEAQRLAPAPLALLREVPLDQLPCSTAEEPADGERWPFRYGGKTAWCEAPSVGLTVSRVRPKAWRGALWLLEVSASDADAHRSMAADLLLVVRARWEDDVPRVERLAVFRLGGSCSGRCWATPLLGRIPWQVGRESLDLDGRRYAYAWLEALGRDAGRGLASP